MEELVRDPAPGEETPQIIPFFLFAPKGRVNTAVCSKRVAPQRTGPQRTPGPSSVTVNAAQETLGTGAGDPVASRRPPRMGAEAPASAYRAGLQIPPPSSLILLLTQGDTTNRTETETETGGPLARPEADPTRVSCARTLARHQPAH